jgi:hypothetical protein
MLSVTRFNTTSNYEFADFAGLSYVDSSSLNATFDLDYLSSCEAESNYWHNGSGLGAMVEPHELSEPYQTNELPPTDFQSNLDSSSEVLASLATIEPMEIQLPTSCSPTVKMGVSVSSEARFPVVSFPSFGNPTTSSALPQSPKTSEVIPKKRLKRSFEESIPGFQCFSQWVQVPPAASAQKPAGATTVMQRKKRQKVKEKGACLRCRMYKLSVSLPLIMGSVGINSTFLTNCCSARQVGRARDANHCSATLLGDETCNGENVFHLV